MQRVAFISNHFHCASISNPKENCRTGCIHFMPCFYSSQHVGGKKICRCDISHLAPDLEEAFFVGFLPWSVSIEQWSLAISLSCSSHTKIIFRLPKEARFPNLWGRCWSDQRRTRWPSERPGLGMNNHSEKGNQNNHQSAPM